jgi:ABC-type transporter lipoprotein component MlaA
MKKFYLLIVLFYFFNYENKISARNFYIKKKDCSECINFKAKNVFQKKFRKNQDDDEEICKWEKPFLNASKDHGHENLSNIEFKETAFDYKKLDPWEKRNKKILRLNLFLFRNTILPFIYLLDAWIPRHVQNLFLNFTHNFLEPKNYLVYKFSGEHEKAKLCAERFLINTFLGAGGLSNPAEEKFGEKYHRFNEKFDYIFYKKGIKTGRYEVFPIINDYYEREFASDLMEWLVNPIFYFTMPFNYIYYIFYRSLLLTDKKETLFYNRKYDDAIYNNLRDLKSYEVSNY